MTQAQIEARLTLVRGAIDAILTGKVAEYQLAHGERVRRLDLDKLTDEEQRLEILLERAKYGMASVAQIRDPK